ncbi:HNH endonuclease [compost metagenome]
MPMRPSQHRAAGWKPYKEDARKVKRRQAKRALPTNSTRWRRLRAAQLAVEPLCRSCGAAGRVCAATDVDHVDGDDSNNASENLQSLCHSCHSAKTVRENGGFGREAVEPWTRAARRELGNIPPKGEGEGQS